jgi:acyl carrier protein
MGLELLELVLTVEDAFGFSIPDEDAAGLNTVGKLHEYILAHRCHAKQEACLSSIAFYKIRRALISVRKLPRKDVRVSTELATIIPARRRRIWRALEKATGFRLPRLRRPAWVTPVAALATVGLAIAVPVLLSLSMLHGAIFVAILTAGAAGYAFSWLTTLLAFEFPPDCATVGQLAKGALARNYRAIVEQSGKCASDAEVWVALRLIVAEQLGVRPGDLTKETNFVKDLNAG